MLVVWVSVWAIQACTLEVRCDGCTAPVEVPPIVVPPVVVPVPSCVTLDGGDLVACPMKDAAPLD